MYSTSNQAGSGSGGVAEASFESAGALGAQVGTVNGGEEVVMVSNLQPEGDVPSDVTVVEEHVPLVVESGNERVVVDHWGSWYSSKCSLTYLLSPLYKSG